MLRYSTVLGGAALAGSLLAACGEDDADEPAPTATASGSGSDTEDPTETTDDAGDEPTEANEVEDDATEGDDSEDDTEETPVDEGSAGEGVYGGIFKAAVAAPPPTLDVSTSTSAASREAALFVLESLVTYGEDYTLVPLLAESWETSDDGTQITFNLRQGVKFHNGKDMTSEDVIVSFDRFMEVTTRKAEFELVESYEATDDYTVVFTLTQPTLTFFDALAWPAAYPAIFPAEVIKGKAAGELANEDIIGTGPYKFVEWRPDQVFRVERFEDYVPVEGPVDGLGGGKVPYFDEIHLIPVSETGSRIAGIETGEYDFAAEPPTTDFSRLSEDPNLEFLIVEDVRWQVLSFNHMNELSSNLKFRQAIQAALDMDAIGMAITSGRQDFYRAQGSLWFQSSPWYNEEGFHLYNQKDIEKAKQLLEEAGYDGQEVIMVTNRNYDHHYKTVVPAAEQLESELGMNITVDIVDWPAQQERWKEKDTWHMSCTGYLSQANFAPDAFAGFYTSGTEGSAGGGYANPEMDEWFEKAKLATTLEERKEAYANVQRIWHEDVAAIKTVDLFGSSVIRSNIKGYRAWYNATRFWSCWRED